MGPIFDGMGLNITVLSYMEKVGFGFVACRELIPDLWEIADAVPAALEELKSAGRPAASGQARRRRPASV